MVVALMVAFRPFVAAQVLTPDATISVLTIAPGDALYSAFGHTGIRINDPGLPMDIVFNYGTFDFDAPGFYMKFIRGQLDYRMSADAFLNVDYVYREIEKRSITEQVLDLDSLQKQTLLNLLQENYKPENRYYRYDFFFDNCATRPRDMLEKAFPLIDWMGKHEPITFRALLDSSLVNYPWSKFGMDLVLGTKSDRSATLRETMFLPEYLKRHLESAQVSSGAETTPLAIPAVELYQSTEVRKPPLLTPTLTFWLIFLGVALLGFLPGTASFLRAIDFTVFFAVGMAGCLMLFLWFFTDHAVTSNNLNLLLWAWPTHLIAAFVITKGRLSSWLRKYLWITSAAAAITLIGWMWWPQHLPLALIPILALVILRGTKNAGSSVHTVDFSDETT